MALLMAVITAIRTIRSEKQVPPGGRLQLSSRQKRSSGRFWK